MDRAKVEKYKEMDFRKAPPIVVGSDGNILDGYHRANAAKALGFPSIRAYVGMAKQGVAEGRTYIKSIPFTQCPQCRGPIFHESLVNEKQDACYHKVRTRYKVWPSAYASGALVQCRKKGASNWGNKKKK